jgi:Ser/Thr protein kinase RdoA (MazF antagonist)
VAGLSDERASPWLTELCEELADRLHSWRGDDGLVIHGDFTCHNIVAAGEPPEPVGVIDFALAHLEQPVADLAYGLWRSGRPFQEATWIDTDRLADMVQGYCQVRDLSPDQAALLPVFMWGRGVQMAVKAALRGRLTPSPPREVVWLRSNEHALTELAVTVAETTHRQTGRT